MKYKKWILAALVFSVGIGSGYQSAYSQETGSKQVEKSASGQSKISQADMRKVEEALKAKGFDPGPINGQMDKETQAALRSFQQKNKLGVTGDVDKPTAEALGIVIVIE